MSRMSFRVALLRVSDQLTNQQLDNLKFLSRSVLTNSRIDKIRAPLDLFAALEERGKLSAENTNFLHRMLESAGYNEAKRELDQAGFPTHHAQPSDFDQNFLFYECLLKIATELESNHFDHVKFIFKDRLKQNVQKIFTATDLFQLLIQRQIIRSNDLKALQEALYTVGCIHLCNRVVEPYIQRFSLGGVHQQLIGDVVPNTLFSGHQSQSQFQRPVEEETPVANNPNPLGHHVERLSSTSSLSPLSPTFPPGRAESAASTLSSIEEGEPSLVPRRNGSMASQSSMDSSRQPVHLDNRGNLYNISQRPIKQENNYPAQVTHTPYGVHPESQCSDIYYGQPSHSSQSKQPIVEFRPQHPMSEQSPPSVPPNGQQCIQGGHYYSRETQPPPQSQYSAPQHPESQPSHSSQFSPSRPHFQIGNEHLYPQNLPRVAAVFEIDQQQQLSQNQQLQQELARKDTELRLKEDNIRAYEARLMGVQAHISSVSDQHQGREKEYQEKISELETVLRQMTTEAEVQISEMQRLHQQLQVANPTSPQNDEDFYKMNKSPHGVCLIINNHEFYHPDPERKHPTRNGAHVDVHNLTQTFKYLRYKVETKENLSSLEMREVLLSMANRDHTQYDSFICCILTHGEQGVVHGSDSEAVNLNDLAGVMKMCPSLHGKPKLFFIQACRGDKETRGFDVPERDAGGGPYHNTIPQESDFYFGFATPTGSSAYRSRRYGSWFISEVCQVFIKHSYTHDLGAMMVKVNKRVSDAYTKDGFKQSPESVNRLRFQVHFFRFIKGINIGH